MNRAYLNWGPPLAIAAAAVISARCGNNGDNSGFDGSSGDGTISDASQEPNPFQNDGPSTYSDFPSNPIIDPSLPSDIATQFGSPDAGAGMAPCIAEPASDAMIPKNWTPLFLEYVSPGANVFEIRLTVDNQTGQALIYVPTTTYVLDTNLWKALTLHSAGHDVNISVRSGVLDNADGGTQKLIGPPTAESTSTVHIASVNAPGAVVYWSSTGGTSFKGFTVGDMTSKTVLTPTSAGNSSAGDGATTCVSCHTSSPDGKYIVYTRDTATSRAIDARTVVGAAAPDTGDFSPAALALLGRDHQGAPLLNAQHYSSTDSVALSSFYNPAATGTNAYELTWVDLHAADATGWGVVARTGDPRNVSTPTWRHDGTAIAYTSSAGGGEAVIAAQTTGDPTMDIYVVPYNNRAGGTSAPLAGASDPNFHEFYPVFSPNDTLLAFNRTDNTPPNSYNQPAAELFIVPGGGGSAQRLRANDPPACTTLASPGLTNAWPRWAPQAQADGDYRYYWTVFSSKRRPATGLNPQLYVAAIVTKVSGMTETIYADYPAIYVLAQDPTQNNHTPAWDNFDVQDIPPN